MVQTYGCWLHRYIMAYSALEEIKEEQGSHDNPITHGKGESINIHTWYVMLTGEKDGEAEEDPLRHCRSRMQISEICERLKKHHQSLVHNHSRISVESLSFWWIFIGLNFLYHTRIYLPKSYVTKIKQAIAGKVHSENCPNSTSWSSLLPPYCRKEWMNCTCSVVLALRGTIPYFSKK